MNDGVKAKMHGQIYHPTTCRVIERDEHGRPLILQVVQDDEETWTSQHLVAYIHEAKLLPKSRGDA